MLRDWLFVHRSAYLRSRIRMKFLAPTLLLYLSFLLDDIAQAGTYALRLSGKRIPPEERGKHGVARRAVMTATAPSDLNNNQDLKYFTNITLNEEVFPVLIDTGRCVLSRVSRRACG